MKKVWIKKLSAKKKNQIKKILQEGNFLPFYTKTGTSVFTSRVTPDFESLWYNEEEFNYHRFQPADCNDDSNASVEYPKRGKK